ncbi:MAG: hypothetical protein F6K25_26990 [Okeania sp. SIO2G4]|uniref:hypothetical protein n=1 Tax=unclassified Okeania TaxID=2634635 RepID=UPI0013B90C58|nr:MULTISPECIES: hypothetical protein [unclassified Okeania]NEP03663.1 hypothetical protein [Okeania sp. SIO4D6]NEP38632.1 hypothetical protein [Okeania sp. SIO2H7]NEP73584.1 hypothetical protein [Okeania sp. SIO2G5]NEP94233.1 hypothetical protein [Okeania sp. SIO2F5]NEQ94099.1 hypothetical protein [Okeania sp. SIO2G4]
MTIILDDLEPEILEKLQDQALHNGRTLTEEIQVILTKELASKTIKTPEELGWSRGFFERTAGSCADDPIVIDNGGIDESLDDSVRECF